MLNSKKAKSEAVFKQLGGTGLKTELIDNNEGKRKSRVEKERRARKKKVMNKRGGRHHILKG